ncbi:hypothetical protein SELMODRAFT_411649 [Selaginella moellendorffii]|uniref:Uncharacterized protein n=1 Tax=Selaginella moellendorffii TaxID=88036 RepID=D8RIL2_SELML|nr:hypothetical protein SELMODRAFT_411649 [Selaginella moellendorffii]
MDPFKWRRLGRQHRIPRQEHVMRALQSTAQDHMPASSDRAPWPISDHVPCIQPKSACDLDLAFRDHIPVREAIKEIRRQTRFPNQYRVPETLCIRARLTRNSPILLPVIKGDYSRDGNDEA